MTDARRDEMQNEIIARAAQVIREREMGLVSDNFALGYLEGAVKLLERIRLQEAWPGEDHSGVVYNTLILEVE